MEKIQEFREALFVTLILLSLTKEPFPFSAKKVSSLNGSRIIVAITSLLYSTEIVIQKYGNPCKKLYFPFNVSTTQ